MRGKSSEANKRRAARRRQILAATLRLVRRHGTGISTAQIAAEANCSKETLYNWFADRDGIFAALVEEQAQSMGQTLQASVKAHENSFEERLTRFATALLDIMTGDPVIVVNRIAMSQTCSENPVLGEAVRQRWNDQIIVQFERLLKTGDEMSRISGEGVRQQFDILLGLLLRDRQRRLLLGEDCRPKGSDMQAMAQEAVQNWLRIQVT